MLPDVSGAMSEGYGASQCIRSVMPFRRQGFTMLPANLRMMNYATDVMYSDISKDTVPEPMRRKSTELLVICDALYSGNVSAIMQSMGAVRMRLT